MSTHITLGDIVTYAKDGFEKKGHVSGIKRDIANGQGFAIVEVHDDLPGITDIVELSQLSLAAEVSQ